MLNIFDAKAVSKADVPMSVCQRPLLIGIAPSPRREPYILTHVQRIAKILKANASRAIESRYT